jgi:hypothetical protein
MCGMYRWLRDNGLPEGCKILCLSATTPRAQPNGARSALPGSQSNEKDGYMPKSDMIGTDGEIAAIYLGEVRHAEI